MRTLVRAQTRITHSDPKAEFGALTVALAAYVAATRESDITPQEFLALIRQHVDDTEFNTLLRKVADSLERGESAGAFAASIGCANGVSGYMYHTLPCVLHVWLAHQRDYRAAVTAMIRLGGDSDTTAAIVGAIVGARVGKTGIPGEWITNLAEWPRTVPWMKSLAQRLSQCCREQRCGQRVWINPALLLMRNVVFMLIVMAHGFRRLLPPY